MMTPLEACDPSQGFGVIGSSDLGTGNIKNVDICSHLLTLVSYARLVGDVVWQFSVRLGVNLHDRQR
jgi:hypothetical protein